MTQYQSRIFSQYCGLQPDIIEYLAKLSEVIGVSIGDINFDPRFTMSVSYYDLRWAQGSEP